MTIVFVVTLIAFCALILVGCITGIYFLFGFML
jgi:hypothetical protein